MNKLLISLTFNGHGGWEAKARFKSLNKLGLGIKGPGLILSSWQLSPRHEPLQSKLGLYKALFNA